MKKNVLNILKFLLFLSIGLGILYLVYRQQNIAYQEECAMRGVPEGECSLIGKVLNDFTNANYFWIFMVLVAFTVSNISRTIRWLMLIKPLGYRPRPINAFGSIVIGYFANLGLPRMGEVIRAGTLANYEKIGVEKVMGTIVVDRIVDVISILLVTALAIALEYDTMISFAEQYINLGEKFGGLGGLLKILAPIGLLGLITLYLLRNWLRQSKIFRKIEAIAFGFYEGLRSISRLDKPGLFLLHSINIWFMYFLMNYMLFFSFEPTSNLSPLVALVVFVFGGWGIVIPSPGGMGTYHFLVQTALMMYGLSGDDGFSFANIGFFSVQLGCNVILGILALLLLPVINRHYQPQQPLAEAYATVTTSEV